MVSASARKSTGTSFSFGSAQRRLFGLRRRLQRTFSGTSKGSSPVCLATTPDSVVCGLVPDAVPRRVALHVGERDAQRAVGVRGHGLAGVADHGPRQRGAAARPRPGGGPSAPSGRQLGVQGEGQVQQRIACRARSCAVALLEHLHALRQVRHLRAARTARRSCAAISGPAASGRSACPRRRCARSRPERLSARRTKARRTALCVGGEWRFFCSRSSRVAQARRLAVHDSPGRRSRSGFARSPGERASVTARASGFGPAGTWSSRKRGTRARRRLLLRRAARELRVGLHARPSDPAASPPRRTAASSAALLLEDAARA